MRFLRLLPFALVAAALTPGALLSAPPPETPPDVHIGYTELRTNLPGGRHANVTTILMRLDDQKERRLTDLPEGRAAMWPPWQPATNKP